MTASSDSSLHKKILTNTFALVEKNLKKKKLSQVRDDKRKIMLKETAFFIKLNDSVMDANATLMSDANIVTTLHNDAPNPTFRSECKRLILMNE